MQTNLSLSVKLQTVTIPYPAVDRAESPHQGFVQLKGDADAAATLPAVQDSAALRQALEKINATTTPFFTVACKLVLNSDANGFWARGYLEFCLNSIELAKDSPNYFLLFEQFNHYVQDCKIDLPVDYEFQLYDAIFPAIKADGHTICVWLTTAQFPNEEGALKTWNMSISALADFLSSFEKPELAEIFQG